MSKWRFLAWEMGYIKNEDDTLYVVYLAISNHITRKTILCYDDETVDRL